MVKETDNFKESLAMIQNIEIIMVHLLGRIMVDG